MTKTHDLNYFMSLAGEIIEHAVVGAGHAREQKNDRGRGPLLQKAIRD
jgi:hypothetical protein